MVDEKLDQMAKKAGEEFLAAGRAETSEQRKRHRASAESYQELVDLLRKERRRRNGPAPAN